MLQLSRTPLEQVVAPCCMPTTQHNTLWPLAGLLLFAQCHCVMVLGIARVHVSCCSNQAQAYYTGVQPHLDHSICICRMGTVPAAPASTQVPALHVLDCKQINAIVHVLQQVQKSVNHAVVGLHSPLGVHPPRGTQSPAPTLLALPDLVLLTRWGAGLLCPLMLAWPPWASYLMMLSLLVSLQHLVSCTRAQHQMT